VSSCSGGALQQALPFGVGALIQLTSYFVSLYVTNRFNKAFDRAWDDNSGNPYLLPANFDQKFIKARYARDFDVIQSVATLFAVIPSILLFVDPKSTLYPVGLLIAAVAPILIFIALISWPPLKYVKFSDAKLNVIHVSIANLFAFILYATLAGVAYANA
jgi:hypothetical protein